MKSPPGLQAAVCRFGSLKLSAQEKVWIAPVAAWPGKVEVYRESGEFVGIGDKENFERLPFRSHENEKKAVEEKKHCFKRKKPRRVAKALAMQEVFAFLNF